jgi:hypothetical protein
VVLAILNSEAVDLTPMEEALKAAIIADLTAVAMASMGEFAEAAGLGLDEAVAQTAASAWARQHAGQLVQGVTATTQAAVQSAVATFLETPGMNREQLASLLQGAFGRARSEVISITEVTRAASAGAQMYQNELRKAGLDFVRVWRTTAQDTCPVCKELNGKQESAWADRFPNGPPAHPRCKCSVTLKPVKT